jgi:hypothetical protein
LQDDGSPKNMRSFLKIVYHLEKYYCLARDATVYRNHFDMTLDFLVEIFYILSGYLDLKNFEQKIYHTSRVK